MHYCWKCKREVEMEVKITRYDTCEFCGTYLRCCYNCKFYDPGAQNQCKEPNSGYTPDRQSGNFCSFFEFIKGKEHLQRIESKDDVKKKFDSLFKK